MQSKEYKREWKLKNKERVATYNQRYRKTHRRENCLQTASSKYGISREEVERLWQSNCAVCTQPAIDNTGGKNHIDHDHVTGAVRGALCSPCNQFLGHLEKHGLDKAEQLLLYASPNRVSGSLDSEEPTILDALRSCTAGGK